MDGHTTSIYYNKYCFEKQLTDFVFIILAITNPKVPGGSKEAIKSFNFDYSYQSHDVSFECNQYYSLICFKSALEVMVHMRTCNLQN